MQNGALALHTTRHKLEQWAYEQIRWSLSQKFIQDPVAFMQEFGKRPEDLSGAVLRQHYHTVGAQHIEIRDVGQSALQSRFKEGRFFQPSFHG